MTSQTRRIDVSKGDARIKIYQNGHFVGSIGVWTLNEGGQIFLCHPQANVANVPAHLKTEYKDETFVAFTDYSRKA